MAFPIFPLFKVGKKVAERTGIIEGPDPNRPKRSAYIVLQILKYFTIFVLLGIIAAEWIMIIINSIPEAFFVFHAITHVLVSFLAIFLILAEFKLIPKNYLNDNWPLLSETHGLTWLGFILIALGCKVLGNLTETANSQENIGMPFWRLILATGILNIIFGFLNILCSYVYSTPIYTSRKVRHYGSKLDGKDNSAREYNYDSSSQRSNSSRGGSVKRSEKGSFNEKPKTSAFNRFTRSFYTKNEKNHYNISQPSPIPVEEIGQAVHYGRDVEADAGSYYSQSTTRREHESPIMAGIVQPNPALHPHHNIPGASTRNKHLTTYSEADYDQVNRL